MKQQVIETIALDAVAIIERQRQRKLDFQLIDDLKASLQQYGLLQPIVVSKTPEGYLLIAGERRITAARALGWTHISAHILEPVDSTNKEILEYVENAHRMDLHWTDKMQAVVKLSGLIPSMEALCANLGLVERQVSNYLRVNTACTVNPELRKLPRFTDALAVVERGSRRALADLTNSIDEIDDVDLFPETLPAAEPEAVEAPKLEPAPAVTYTPKPKRYEIINTDFTTWAANYSGPKFSFIHCDFPYGISYTDSKQYGRGEVWDADIANYDDSEDVYKTLVAALLTNHEKLVAPNAFLLFWFSMTYYDWTLKALGNKWRVQPFPLIWGKSDSKGIIPDPRRGPRRCYETALLATVGDVQIIQSVSNICWQPTTKEHHVSEKPVAVLQHFFRMICNAETRLLDPTCGGGTGPYTALTFGASAVGVELNPEHAAAADRRCGYLELGSEPAF